MRIPAVDLVVALGLALAGQVEVWTPQLMAGTGTVDGSRPVLAATALVMAGAVAFLRVRPVAATFAIAAAAAVQGLLTVPTQGLTGLVIFVVAAASVASAAGAGAYVGVGLLLVGLIPQSADVADWSFTALLVIAAWSAGFALRRRIAALRRAEADRDVAAERERARIARELHDIVSHRVTTIVVQAQAAQTRPQDADALRTTLDAIETAGREALAELRDLLGVLRSVEGEDRKPQPALDDVPSLVADVRRAGVPVDLRIEGAPYPVEPGVGLAAYRIVQEALTNIAKHARAARAEIVLRYDPGELAIEVTDDGAAAPPAGRGNGLIGMRERVSVYGGTLEAGPRGEGGYSVHATLPVRPR